MREKSVENRIKNYLKSKGAYYVKYFGNKFSQVGVPDLLVCYRGMFVAIEVKNDKGKTSPLQDINLQQIKDAGGYSIVARSVKDVEVLIGHIDMTIKHIKERLN